VTGHRVDGEVGDGDAEPVVSSSRASSSLVTAGPNHHHRIRVGSSFWPRLQHLTESN